MINSTFELLLALRQTQTANEFVNQFENYAGAMKGIDEEHFMGIFLHGLKEEVGAELKLYEPRDLSEMMSKGQKIEEKYMAVARVVDTKLVRGKFIEKLFWDHDRVGRTEFAFYCQWK